MSTTNIPGPREWPLVGSLFQYRESNINFLMKLVREYGDIVRFSALGTRFVLIAEPEAVHEVLVRQVANFPKDEFDVGVLSKYIGRGLVTTNGETHRQQRRLTQPAFHARRIQSYAETMVDYTLQTLEAWTPGTVRDVNRDMVDLTMFIVSKTIFDTDRDAMATEAHAIGDAIHQLQGLADQEYDDIIPMPEWLPLPRHARYRRARSVVDATVERILAERRAGADSEGVTDRGDLLSMLLLSQDEEGHGMSDAEVRDQLVTLFIAGHETTSNALSWTWYLLSQNPHVEAKLHAELDRVLAGRTPTLADLRELPYTSMVLKESMRIYPPAWTLNLRKTKEATTLGDYRVEPGDVIMVSPYAIHHNPRLYPEPHKFDPERFAPEQEAQRHRYAYIPFGGGPRVCIGNSFATMEAELIIATIAQRYQMQFVGTAPVERQAQITMSPKGGLPMRIHPRTPAVNPVGAAPQQHPTQLETQSPVPA